MIRQLQNTGSFDPGHDWIPWLVREKVLVPEDLLAPPANSNTVAALYLRIFKELCAVLRREACWPQVEKKLLQWCGESHNQPQGRSRVYLPSLPSLALELDNPGIRICVDCRNPLLNTWENIRYARRILEAQLACDKQLFNTLCDEIFDNKDRFKNNYIKYIHPTIEFFPDSEDAAIYWNMGSDTPAGLWDRLERIIRKTGCSMEQERKLREKLGERYAPELVGLSFDTAKPKYLKFYHVIYGFNKPLLLDIFKALPELDAFKASQRAVEYFEPYIKHPRESKWIITIYHSLQKGLPRGL